MTTINISLPARLKTNADELIAEGHFVSFSDLVRTALRKLLSESKYDRMAKEAMADYKKGKLTVLRTNKDIKEYIKKL